MVVRIFFLKFVFGGKGQRGFLTLEFLIVIGVVCLCLLGAVSLVWGSQQAAIDNGRRQEAVLLAEQTMASDRLLAKSDFAALASSQSSAAGFLIQSAVSDLAVYIKAVVVTVGWQGSGGAGRSVALAENFIDLANLPAADSCAAQLSGLWQAPQLRGSVTNPQNSPATGLAVYKNKVYVAANGNGTLDDFFVIDAADIDHPAIVKSLNTGPGISAVALAGGYAYAANTSINGQLQIIKISDPANPAVMLNVKFAAAGTGGVGNSIYYYRQRVYIGTPKNSGPEFYVYDVSSPPAPQFLGSYEVGSVVNKIYVQDHYAYLATAGQQDFLVLDIADPAHISQAGAFSAQDWGSQSGQSLALLGGRALFGRAGGLPGAGIPELYWLDASSPAALASTFSRDLNFSVNDIFWRGDLAFLAGGKNGGQFQVFNTSSGRPEFASAADLGADALALGCDGQNLFAALNSNKILQIVSGQ